jgi:hypothetical protein
MTTDRLKNSTLPRAFSDVVADIADLFQKELQLARAELSDKLTIKLRAGVWMSAAAAFALLAAGLVVQALVLWIATFGIAIHLSCLVVAVLMAVVATLTYRLGRADAHEELTLRRTIHQLKEDIITTKEQLR